MVRLGVHGLLDIARSMYSQSVEGEWVNNSHLFSKIFLEAVEKLRGAIDGRSWKATRREIETEKWQA